MDGARETGEALIEVRGQVVEFGYRKIVSNIDVAVQAGEMVALIVPNGAEKSTVVRVMLGLLRPDRGEVTRRKILMIGYLRQRRSVDRRRSAHFVCSRPVGARRQTHALRRSNPSSKSAIRSSGSSSPIWNRKHGPSGFHSVAVRNRAG
ncbi:MAG: Zinc import ATP-binding protein ZnuC [Alphaproteobacteria bacterium MarineAlpha3_Bin4]|nr:MAG: Zinc import ATP-binding protein ZnuC [Alphaproteobacteria bacterium MarineAlpha3_Bin4]